MMPSTVTVVRRSTRSMVRAAVVTWKSATAPSVVRVPSGMNSGVAARSSMVWRASARKARRICTSRSLERNSFSRSPRIATAMVCATTCVGRPSCAARARSTRTRSSCSPAWAVERTESKPSTSDSRRTSSFDSSTSRSVESPERRTLKPSDPPWFSSKRKLGLPMMISGMSFSISFISSRGSIGSSSRGLRRIEEDAWSGV